MRIRNQFIISMTIFSAMLLIVIASVIVTYQQIARLDRQQYISENVEKGADELNTLSSQYFLYQQPQQLTQWQSSIGSISGNLSNLNPTNSKQQTLVNNTREHLSQLNTGFAEIVSFLATEPRNVSVRVMPEFQNAWNQMVTEHQTFALDASLLSESLRTQANQLRLTTIALIIALLGIFGAFFLTNYLITYRRTLKSISNLQAGINIIGSGNLDYSVSEDKEDEIGELSSSFNQMTADLKNVTTSKKELEREVTERKKAEEQLKASQAALETERNILQTIMSSPKNIHLVYLDRNFNFVHVNEAYAKTCRYTREQMSGKNHFALYPNEENEAIFARVRDNGIPAVYYDKPFVFPDQPERGVTYWDWTLEAVKDKAGKTEGLVFSLVETTERKKAEEKLEQYSKNLEQLVEDRTKQLRDFERMAAIGQTAGMVGHDIRNPLQSIIGELYLAKSSLKDLPDGEAKDDLKENVEIIEQQVVYINKILADLQDFAKASTPQLQETDLSAIVEDVVSNLDIPENVSFSCDIEDNFPKFVTDPAFVKRILTNLVSNAVQAMPNGGQLSVTTATKGEKMVLSVADTGEGIPENIKCKIFSPLFTTKSKGQGFGLAAVKKLTEALGGYVSFESEVGKGTKFIVELPL